LGNPWIMDTAELLYKNDNVFTDISGLVVGEDLNTPYGEMMKQKINELIHFSSDRKLLYGTDWPLATMDTYLRFARSLTMSPDGQDRMFYKNAVELFHINNP